METPAKPPMASEHRPTAVNLEAVYYKLLQMAQALDDQEDEAPASVQDNQAEGTDGAH